MPPYLTILKMESLNLQFYVNPGHGISGTQKITVLSLIMRMVLIDVYVLVQGVQKRNPMLMKRLIASLRVQRSSKPHRLEEEGS